MRKHLSRRGGASAGAVLLLVLSLSPIRPLGAQRSSAATAPSRTKLAVIVAVDGLSWERLDAYRPWFKEGLGHGSHHSYDTHVPLLFWGGPFRPAVRAEPAAPYDLAPTFASLLGVRLDDKATGVSRAPGRPEGQ